MTGACLKMSVWPLINNHVLLRLSHKSVAVMLLKDGFKWTEKLSLSQNNTSNLSAEDTNQLAINEDSDNDN